MGQEASLGEGPRRDRGQGDEGLSLLGFRGVCWGVTGGLAGRYCPGLLLCLKVSDPGVLQLMFQMVMASNYR